MGGCFGVSPVGGVFEEYLGVADCFAWCSAALCFPRNSSFIFLDIFGGFDSGSSGCGVLCVVGGDVFSLLMGSGCLEYMRVLIGVGGGGGIGAWGILRFRNGLSSCLISVVVCCSGCLGDSLLRGNTFVFCCTLVICLVICLIVGPVLSVCFFFHFFCW